MHVVVRLPRMCAVNRLAPLLALVLALCVTNLAPPAHAARLTYMGSSGKDKMRGNALANPMFGGRSRDRLYGFGGNDAMHGGTGGDTLGGGSGADAIMGDEARHRLLGPSGGDPHGGGA